MYKKIGLISGATSGLGKDLSIKLSQQGFKLILLGKSKLKLNRLKRKINNNIHEYYSVNLSDLKNIKSFLEKLKHIKKIDLLVNNAGGIINEKNNINKSKNINLNYLSHIYLTKKLTKKIKNSKIQKIIFISSHVHKNIDKFEFLKINKTYNAWKLYKLSKLFLTTYSVILKKEKNKIKIFTINPGRISSNFNIQNNKLLSKLINVYLYIFGNNTDIVSKKIIKLIEKKTYNKKYFYFDIDKPSKINQLCLNETFQKKLLKFTKLKLSNL